MRVEVIPYTDNPDRRWGDHQHIPPDQIQGFAVLEQNDGQAAKWQADLLLRRWALSLAQLIGDELGVPASYIEMQSDGRKQIVRINNKRN